LIHEKTFAIQERHLKERLAELGADLVVVRTGEMLQTLARKTEDLHRLFDDVRDMATEANLHDSNWYQRFSRLGFPKSFTHITASNFTPARLESLSLIVFLESAGGFDKRKYGENPFRESQERQDRRQRGQSYGSIWSDKPRLQSDVFPIGGPPGA
jgi:hypothetical protein